MEPRISPSQGWVYISLLLSWSSWVENRSLSVFDLQTMATLLEISSCLLIPRFFSILEGLNTVGASDDWGSLTKKSWLTPKVCSKPGLVDVKYFCQVQILNPFRQNKLTLEADGTWTWPRFNPRKLYDMRHTRCANNVCISKIRGHGQTAQKSKMKTQTSFCSLDYSAR